MEVKLLVVNEKVDTKQLRLGAETIIGRAPECQLRIASGRVSRQHCVIRVGENQVTVRDLGSANGTLLNDQRISTDFETPVLPGQRLMVGPLKFVFDFDLPEAVSGLPTSYQSPSQSLGLNGPPANEEETKDYTPPSRRRKLADTVAASSESGELDFDEGESEEPAGVIEASAAITPGPDDTVYDPGLADHARAAAERARDESASVLSESGTDLLFEDQDTPPTENRSGAGASTVAAPDEPSRPGSPTEKGKGKKLFGFLRREGTEEGWAAKPESPPPQPKPAESAPAGDDNALNDFFKQLG